MQQMITSILRKALRMGFQRLVIISMHGPNDAMLMPVARRFFEIEGVPVFVPQTDLVQRPQDARALCQAGYLWRRGDDGAGCAAHPRPARALYRGRDAPGG